MKVQRAIDQIPMNDLGYSGVQIGQSYWVSKLPSDSVGRHKHAVDPNHQKQRRRSQHMPSAVPQTLYGAAFHYLGSLAIGEWQIDPRTS